MTPSIRLITPSDNVPLAKVVRGTMAEFGVNKPGTVFFDPTTDALYELFQAPGAIYFVAEMNGEILGGAGIYPTPGLPEKVCELAKMYLLPKARGHGLGRTLIEKCLAAAKEKGYEKI